MASSSSSATKPNSISLIFFLFLSTIFSLSISSSIIRTPSDPVIPIPTPWPQQFHSILVMNYSGSLQVIDLWYDWPNGRNFNIIQKQLGEILYDLEWNNGTSFFYTLEDSSSTTKKCRSVQLEVGILRPNWLQGANYLGQQAVDGFLCNVWEKVDFIWYYEDVITKRPVQWMFYTGRTAHVMTFEVGAVLEDTKWQAPPYCFQKREKEEDNPLQLFVNVDDSEESLMEEGILRGPSGGGSSSSSRLRL